MEFLTGKHVSRRTVLRGMGAAIGLPLLDAMIPARRLWASSAAARSASRTRLVCIEQVHGVACHAETTDQQHIAAVDLLRSFSQRDLKYSFHRYGCDAQTIR